MDTPKIDLSRTELDFLKRLLLDLQQELGCTREASDEELAAAVELSVATLQGDGREPPPRQAQVRPSAPIQLKPGSGATSGLPEERSERRRRSTSVH